jgi:hypothetical protein
LPTLLGQLICGFEVLFSPRLADEAREEFHFRSESLRLLQQRSVLDVEGQYCVHRAGRHAPTGQGGLYNVRFAAKLDEINHVRHSTET